ncbi:MAG: peptidoglycan recognition family protein [Acidobacteriota bacterium]|nr:peptidoglycan recognition family protein [Acidobacteriota bacterium]
METTKFFLPTRRDLMKMGGAFLLVPAISLFPSPSHANNLRIENRFSPLNKKRPRRPSTRYIILHTTEGEEEGSLRKIVRYGEAHYCVCPSGKVCRIIDKDKIAKHAGRSMWEGRSAIDNHSIGIEVVGYHNKDITDAQYAALRELLSQLKSLYGIADKNVLTHSMVAYGRPNRFHHDSHRGRKRCGMIFARADVRARLGLQDKPDHDADVDAGRLRVADRELFSYLFAPGPKAALVAAADKPAAAAVADAPASAPAAIEASSEPSVIGGNLTAWSIAREQYNSSSTVYIFPNGKRQSGDQIQDWARIPSGTRVVLNEVEDNQPFEGFLEIGKDGDTPQAVAGAAYAKSTSIYFFPDGMIRTGAELKKRRSTQKLLTQAPKGTRILVGYVYGGYVKTRRPPSTIAGAKWNYPSTYYRLADGRMLSGDDIDAGSVPAGTLVFYQE